MYYFCTYLAIVESAVYCQVVDIGVNDGRHLGFLDGADLAVREHDEDGDILLSAQTIDGGRTSIATCSTNDSQMFPIAALLALVLAHEEVFEQVAEKLQGNIFEGKCRPVEQLEQMYVLLLVECDGGDDVFCAEGGVATTDDVF